jgi:hypothetical protein
MIGLLIYLGLAFIGFYIVYMVIKISIKHAISESSTIIEKIIRNAINDSRVEYEWKKSHE